MDENNNDYNPVEQSPELRQLPLQPVAMVNGQPVMSSSPTHSSQIEPLSDKKPSRWRYFFIFLGVLQVLGVALFFVIITWAIRQAKAGASGTEFIALALFVTVVPAVAAISVINLIGLPIYMLKHKSHGKGLAFSIVSLIISAILALYGAYSVYKLRVAMPKNNRRYAEQTRQKIEQDEQAFEASKAKLETTKEEAISFMQSCKADYFVGYTDINLVKESNVKSWLTKAEKTSTGIEISEGSSKYCKTQQESFEHLVTTQRSFT